MRSTWR